MAMTMPSYPWFTSSTFPLTSPSSIHVSTSSTTKPRSPWLQRPAIVHLLGQVSVCSSLSSSSSSSFSSSSSSSCRRKLVCRFRRLSSLLLMLIGEDRRRIKARSIFLWLLFFVLMFVCCCLFLFVCLFDWFFSPYLFEAIFKCICKDESQWSV